MFCSLSASKADVTSSNKNREEFLSKAIVNITFLLNIFNTYSLISFIIDDTILNVRSSYYEFQLGRLFGCNDLERFLSPYRQFLN